VLTGILAQAASSAVRAWRNDRVAVALVKRREPQSRKLSI
jgi:hypothetical protein